MFYLAEKQNGVSIATIAGLIAFCFVFVVNFFLPSVDPFRDGKVVIFIFGASVLGAIWVCERYSYWLGGFLLLANVMWLVNELPFYGLRFTAGSVVALVIADFCSRDRHFFYFALRVAAWGNMVLALKQMIPTPGLIVPEPGQTFGIVNSLTVNGSPYGTMGQHMVFGGFLMSLVSLAFAKWSKFEGFLLTAFVFLSWSSTAIVGLWAAVLFYLWRRGRWIVLSGSLFLSLSLPLGAFYFSSTEFFSISGRQVPWSAAWSKIKENPYGYGPGSWEGKYNCVPRPGKKDCSENFWGVQYKQKWDSLHNEWLTVLIELGWAGLFLAIASTVALIRRAPDWIACSLVAVAVSSLGNFNMHVIATSFVVCFFIAVIGREHPNTMEGEGLYGGIRRRRDEAFD